MPQEGLVTKSDRSTGNQLGPSKRDQPNAVPLFTYENTNTEEMQIYIHAPNRIRTNYPSVGAV
jgi:hypothetical protein